MSKPTRSLDEMVKELPPRLQQEVKDFAQFLIERRVRPKRDRLKMAWAGGLREFRDQFTSLELQKKALEWRGD